VDDLTNQSALLRDLSLVKVRAAGETRAQVLKLAEVFKARVLDIALESITLELTGGEEKVDRFLELLTPFGLMEVVRTGIVAMRRGVSKSPTEVAKPAAAAPAAKDDTVSYSV
jgi:acetolactate synthase-1/3 small subunit